MNGYYELVRKIDEMTTVEKARQEIVTEAIGVFQRAGYRVLTEKDIRLDFNLVGNLLVCHARFKELNPRYYRGGLN